MIHPHFNCRWNRNAQIAALRSVGRETETLMVIMGSMVVAEKTRVMFWRGHNNLTERLAIHASLKKLANHVEVMVNSEDYDTDINDSLRSLLGSLECIGGEGDADLGYMVKVCEDALHDACIESILTIDEERELWGRYDSSNDESPQPEYQKEWCDESHSFSI